MIAQIQALDGVRTPGPATSQKSFSLGFIAESFGRTLTPTEITFYDTLAGHYTKPVPDDQAPPLVGVGWPR